MSDSIERRFAELLASYCVRVQAGDRILLQANTPAIPLLGELGRVILQLGGIPVLELGAEEYSEVLLKNASLAQLEGAYAFTRNAYETFEGRIWIKSDMNVGYLDHLPSEQQTVIQRATGPIFETQFAREATGEFKRVTTMYPTTGFAQDAGMGTKAFASLFYRACHLSDPDEDAATYWKSLHKRNDELASRLSKGSAVELHAPDCEISFSIEGRVFEGDSGEFNMPGGEVYTAPVENTVQGRIKFSYPVSSSGVRLAGVDLRFEDGKVVEAHADQGQEALHGLLATDAGASYLGEFGIGTNTDIQRSTGRGLLDEKIAGTIHLALGRAYPAVGGTNESNVHLDIIKDMRTDSEIKLDGEVVYRNGDFLV